MKIKNVYPEYKNQEERRKAIQSTYTFIQRILYNGKGKEHKKRK